MEIQTPTEPDSSQALPSGETEVGFEDNFEEVDFSGLTDFADNGEPDEETLPEEPEVTEPQGVETPETTETPEATPEEPKTPAPAESREEPQEPATSEQATPAEQPVTLPTREELEGMYADHRKNTLPTLEKLYEMDDELAQAFDDNPREVLPKIAAALHYDVMMSAYNAISAALPSMVGQINRAVSQAKEAAEAFYGAWPQLKSVDESVVRTAVQAYRATKPTATMEDVIANAGKLAMLQAGLPLESPPPTSPPPPPPPPPPKPAGAGGISPTPPQRPAQQGDVNPFGELAEAFNKPNYD